ncbi:MAG: VWA domain-containing protein [Clostridia bacterium]|nr:VWA domain-containing protein [Clostridia bacterium]
MKKLCLALTSLLLALCMMSGALATSAETTAESMPETTLASTGSAVDVIMILDYSGSMADNDPNNLMIKSAMNFIDMCDVSGTRIALLPFNSGDEGFLDTNNWRAACGFFRSVSSIDERESIRQDILTGRNVFTYGSYTDGGPAFRRAWALYEANRSDPARNENCIVLFFSDGVITSNGSNPNSSASQASLAEANEHVDKFAEAGVPIYVIGLRGDGGFDKVWLDDIAEQTGTGSARVVTNGDSSVLHETFSEIFAEYLGTEPLPIDQRDIVVTDNTAVISINIPNNSIVEANIRLSLNNPQATFGDIINLTRPNGTAVEPITRGTPRDGDVVVGNSGAYYNMKLIRPSQGEWKLTLNVNEATLVSAEIIANYDIGIRFRNLPNPEEIRKGDPLRLEAEFYSTTTNLPYAEDEYLYQPEMITQSIATKDGEPLGEFFQVERAENGTYLFVGEIEALDQGVYEFQVKVDGAGIQAETEVFRIGLENNPPIRIGSDFSEPVNLSVDSMAWRVAEDTMEVNLHQYFRDPDGDPLTFIVTGRNDVLTTRVTSAGILQITCQQAGECTLSIKANDGELDSTRNLTITFNVKSCKAQAIREIAILSGAALLLLLLLIIIAYKTRGRFLPSAQFEASYSKLTFSMTPHNLIFLSRYNDKKVSLYTVLDDASAGMGACHQIENAEKSVLAGFILKPLRKGAVKLTNRSSGGMNVSVSGTSLPRGKSITLNTGSNVMIEFSEPGRSISLLYRHE